MVFYLVFQDRRLTIVSPCFEEQIQIYILYFKPIGYDIDLAYYISVIWPLNIFYDKSRTEGTK